MPAAPRSRMLDSERKPQPQRLAATMILIALFNWFRNRKNGKNSGRDDQPVS
jgi:hypothetical protein